MKTLKTDPKKHCLKNSASTPTNLKSPIFFSSDFKMFHLVTQSPTNNFLLYFVKYLLFDKSVDILDKIVCHSVSAVKSHIGFLSDAFY